jgi:hypothetical protein
MARARDPLERLRRIVAALPETSERLSHGAPTFWGGKRTFASFAVDHHGDGRIAIWCKLPAGAQGALVAKDPAVFFVPPYVGPSGWVGIRVDRDVDWDLVAALLEEGWRTVAPARALAALEAGAAAAEPAARAAGRRPTRRRRLST